MDRNPRPALGAALAAAAAFALLAWMVEGDWGPARLDDEVLDAAVDHRIGWVTSALRTLTWLGSVSVLIPVVAVASAWLLWRRRDVAGVAVVVLAFVLSAQSKNLLKVVFERPRPPASVHLVGSFGYAFPSGHAADAFAVWVVLAVVLGAGQRAAVRWAMRGSAFAIAIAVGASRVYLGVHWPTDVLAGFALSTFWVAALVSAGEALPPRFRPRAGPART